MFHFQINFAYLWKHISDKIDRRKKMKSKAYISHLKRKGLYVKEKPFSDPKKSLLIPFWWAERKLEVVARWLSNLALLEIFGLLGNISILLAVISFLSEQDNRHDQDILSSWQTVTSASGQTGSGGRLEAIEFMISQPMRFPWPCRYERYFLAESELLIELGLPTEPYFPRCILFQPSQSLEGLDLSSNVKQPFMTGSGVYLSGLQAPKVILSKSNLEYVNLSHANLNQAILVDSKLQSVSLRNAQLMGANLQGSDLQYADLRGANLSGADLFGANLKGSNLTDAILPNARLLLADLSDTVLERTDLHKSDLRGVKLQGSRLIEADLSGAQLDEVNFLEAEELIQMDGRLDSAIYTTKNSVCGYVPARMPPCETKFPEILNPKSNNMITREEHSNEEKS
ncbi:MAG: pentapeptide repeat-containing protein [Verrucomicrobiota bacterium]